jgi:hypothetical protein
VLLGRKGIYAKLVQGEVTRLSKHAA